MTDNVKTHKGSLEKDGRTALEVIRSLHERVKRDQEKDIA